jgi:hypothetical protein
LESWQPFLGLLASFGDLLALARGEILMPSARGRGVGLDPVVAATERFREALEAAFDTELRSQREYHRKRGGLITRIVPRRRATQAACYSDEVKDLAEEQLARMVDMTGEMYVGYPFQLEQKPSPGTG